MPAGLDRGDRKLLAMALAVLLVLSVAFVFFAPAQEGDAESGPSSYSGAPGGARAAFLLLQELHYNVERWEDPPAELPRASAGATLVLAEPLRSPSKQEKESLRGFVERGGRVLFTGASVGLFFAEANVSFLPPGSDWKVFPASFPSAVSRGAEKISLRPKAEWHPLDPLYLTLYGNPDAAVVVRWQLGKGEIFWWAGPSPLTNAGLLREGNLNFLLNTVDPPASRRTAPPHIYWDEYFHGERSSLWGYVAKTPLPWGLAQLGLLGAAVLFAFGRRSGPVAVPPRVSRLSPLEFVDTLGGLYERAGAAPAAVGAALQRFRGLLTRHLRVPATLADAALEEATRQRLGWKGGELLACLQRAAAASRTPKLGAPQALEIVQKLERFEQQLGLKKRKPQEKT